MVYTREIVQSFNPDKQIQDEVWKKYPGCDWYEVSSWGNVRSLDHFVNAMRTNGRPYPRLFKGKQLQVSFHTTYPTVYMQLPGKPDSYLLHRIVGQTFLPNLDNKPTINHKDGNKRNNYIENLEWATYQENNQHAYRTGLAHPNTENMIIAGIEICKKPVKVLETGMVFDSSSALDTYLGEPKGFSDRIIASSADGYSTLLNIHIKRISKQEYDKLKNEDASKNIEEIDPVTIVNRGSLNQSKCVKCVETGVCYNSMTECDRQNGFKIGATGDVVNHYEGYFRKYNLHFERISEREYVNYLQSCR